MSAALAAGWARSSSQSVSVVPMIQWLPHGMMNSRLFSVRVIRPVIAVDPVPRHHQMDALRRPDPELAAAAEHLLQLVDPDPGGVDRLPGPDVELRAGLQVADPDPGHPVGLAQEADHPGAGGAERTVVGRSPAEHHGVPGVVDLALVEADRTDQRLPVRRRERSPASSSGSGAADGAGHPGRHPSRRRRRSRGRRNPGRSPAGAAGRGTAPAWPDAEQSLSSASERSRNASNTSAEVELLEIAQAAVEELGRPAGGAGCVVASLDESDPKPTGRLRPARSRCRSPRRR